MSLPIPKQKSSMGMMTSNLLLLLISCCSYPLLKTSEAGSADQLRKFFLEHKFSSSQSASTDHRFSSNSQSVISPQDGLVEADKIIELPGQPDGVDFDQYAGYVTVDPNNGRALFYYFVEPPQNSSMKPLVLWLNGGPGCSSFIGAMEELGPFRVNSNGKTLYRNYYAWNKVANVIFLESPVGVGFSYSNTSSDYDESGDNRTANDSYTFLLNWLERFPQYKTREFYITGESYAGHYVPELAYTILYNNKITNQTVVTLQGIAIGNGYFDDVAIDIGAYEYLWSHALISDETYDMIHTKCNFSSNTFSDECMTALNNADKELGDIDHYNIYAPVCHGSNNSTGSGIAMADYDPCSDNYLFSYLNNPAVQKALHANITSLPYPCNLTWNDSPNTMLPTIIHIITSGIRVWFYSGDVDGVCPISSTRYFIKMLGLPIKNSWRPWYLNNEVGGYVEEYNGVTLATIRGAGHQVPSYQPERALTMISSFLQGKLPPSFKFVNSNL